MQPVLDAIRPAPGTVVVDCTLGLGGHSAEILRRIKPGGQLIGIDFDPANLALSQTRLSKIGGDFYLHHANFAALPQILASDGIAQVDAVLADLGVASPQIDDPARGFSYRQDGPLDMRMDPTRGTPAWAILQRLNEIEIAQALLELGDETDAHLIAHLIVQRRAQQPIQTTRQLMEIVCEARDFTVQRAAGAKLHPAARTFQALRILINREIGNLENLLRVLPKCLKPGGIAVIITFHSGEDRPVKDAFKAGLQSGAYSQIAPDPILANDAEKLENPRSRSAKLRWARV